MEKIKFHKVPRLGLKSDSLTHPTEEEKNLSSNLSIQKVEGPFDENGKLIEYVSRNHEYIYRVIVKEKISQGEVYNIDWAVSYDDAKNTEAFYLFSGGRLKNGHVEVNIQISKGDNNFKIYGYVGKVPNNNLVEVNYKKIIAFFIGGAGDKKPFLGSGPTTIVERFVRAPFDKYVAPIRDYKSYYLGYNEVYKDNVKNIVLPSIPNKKGVSINIIGHSLGGWNAAHLSQILTDKGYDVNLLITLDPVGSDPIINVFSDIYGKTPNPKSTYWINIHTSPDLFDADFSDYIAGKGVQWIPPESDVQIMHFSKNNHGDAGGMFKEQLKDVNISASDFLLYFSNLYLNEK